MIICSAVAFPLAVSMITVGAMSIDRCSLESQISQNISKNETTTDVEYEDTITSNLSNSTEDYNNISGRFYSVALSDLTRDFFKIYRNAVHIISYS